MMLHISVIPLDADRRVRCRESDFESTEDDFSRPDGTKLFSRRNVFDDVVLAMDFSVDHLESPAHHREQADLPFSELQTTERGDVIRR
ncbi:MAG: hypothetical protein ACK56I_26525 [bacterium]